MRRASGRFSRSSVWIPPPPRLRTAPRSLGAAMALAPACPCHCSAPEPPPLLGRWSRDAAAWARWRAACAQGVVWAVALAVKVSARTHACTHSPTHSFTHSPIHSHPADTITQQHLDPHPPTPATLPQAPRGRGGRILRRRGRVHTGNERRVNTSLPLCKLTLREEILGVDVYFRREKRAACMQETAGGRAGLWRCSFESNSESSA